MTETTYEVGDLVEAVHGDIRIAGRLIDPYKNGELAIGGTGWSLHSLRSAHYNFTLTVIEKAAPKNVLPTEAGWYLNSQGQVWHLAGVGEWRTGSERLALWEAELLTGGEFTRLEPVDVTARKVLDEVRGIFGLNSLARDEVERIAAKFGASS